MRPPTLPDPVVVARAEKHPESGPRIVFLSGGSALHGLSRALPRYTHRSVHLITPFDSGGSSAQLRAAFGMLAVGDLRNRLLALADDSSRRLRRALQARLPKGAPPDELASQLSALASGRHPLLADLRDSERTALSGRFGCFERRMPQGFDLRGASLGNLVLAAGQLESGSVHTALDQLAAMLRVRGRVLPTVEDDLHLAARLADGSQVVGQHRLTGKEHPPLQSRIEKLSLVSLAATGDPVPARPRASARAVDEISRADLVCFPMGSFYSSLLCNLLPGGIGSAIASAACPKVYVPSTGRDPELVDTDLGRAAELLVAALRADAGDVPVARLLDWVLLDESLDVYSAPPDPARIEALGALPISTQLVTPGSLPEIDADRLAQALVTLSNDVKEAA